MPCSIKERLKSLCPGKWLIAKGGRDDNDETTHYIWLDRRSDERHDLIGPGWKSLWEAYDLHMGDYVTFAFVEQHNHFHVEVISGQTGIIKPWVRFPGMLIVLSLFCVIFHFSYDNEHVCL